jgi:hypothetical protein
MPATQRSEFVAAPELEQRGSLGNVLCRSYSPLAEHPDHNTDWREPYATIGTQTSTVSSTFPANTSRRCHRGTHGKPLSGQYIQDCSPIIGRTVLMGGWRDLRQGAMMMLGYAGIP